ncbi:hypothetical protein FI667_g7659, partial [Globisporangium splendens]
MNAQHQSLTLTSLNFLYTLTTAHSSPKSRSKRARALAVDCEIDENGRTSEDSSASKTAMPPTKKKASSGNSVKGAVSSATATKQRKRSYLVNKEEKEKLREELVYLEARAALLRHEIKMVSPQVLESKRALRAELRNAVLQQHLTVASTQSMFSGFANSRVTSPLEVYIHLTTDWQQRRNVLLEMRDRKIDVAHRFLVERTRFIDPFQESSEQSRYVTAEGEYCAIKLDVVPFEEVASVRQVFNAMHFYLTNLEIAMTEMSGNVTVRENDENTEAAALQYRLVTFDRGGVLVEKNAVLFMDTSGLDCGNVDDQSALFAIDFVNQDDLYPYCPNQRLRNDSTCVMKLSAHRRMRIPNAPSDGASGCVGDETNGEEDELVVVLTHLSFMWLRKPEISVPEPVLRSIADDLTGGFNLMVKSMRDDMHPTSASVQ